MVSPYLDEHLVNCLLELRERGVVVDLVTMEDSVGHTRSRRRSSRNYVGAMRRQSLAVGGGCCGPRWVESSRWARPSA